MAAVSTQVRRELSLELLDLAKAGKGDKLQLLLQIEEIVLRREVSLVAEIVPEVLELMHDRSVDIRKFLVELSGSALEKSYAILPAALGVFNHLVTDSNELVLTRMSLELRKAYDKMVMNIVNIPLKTTAKQSTQQADPKQMWQHLRTVTNRLVDVISSDRGEKMRDAALSLAESVVLFGLPAPPVTHDPRLKRSAVKDSGGGSGLSVEDVPLHHAFINRNELEHEAEDIFKKMLLWTTRGGPQGFPFTPNQMSILGQGIARIASQRPRNASGSAEEEGRGGKAAQVLVVMLTGKSNVCKDMRGSSREALAKATNALLRSPFSSMADPQGLVGKLRAALTALEALGFEDSHEPGKKRPASEMESGEGEEDVEQEKKRRLEAVTALNAAEESIRSKTLQGDEVATSGGTVIAGAIGSAMLQKNDTELAADIAVPYEVPVGNRGALASVTQKTAANGNSEVVMRLLPPSSEGSGDLAMATLQRLLDSYYDIKSFNEKALVSHAKLAVRTASSMALVDLATARTLVVVPLVVSMPVGVNTRLSEGVPMDMQLPRSLWQLVSFTLSPPPEEENTAATPAKQASSFAAAVKEKMVLVLTLLEDLRERADDEAAAVADDGDGGAPYLFATRPCATLYDAVCTVVVARLLQNINLRELAKPLLTSLAWVPRSCLSLLKLLMHTGTKAASAPAPTLARQAPKKEVRNRGTRMEAMTLLTHLVFAVDEQAGSAALNHLLWCCMSEEFETRSKAVTLLVNDVLPGGDWVVELISSFAVQAAGTLVGADAALLGEAASTAVRKQKWELPSELKAAAEKEEAEKKAAGAMEVDGDGAKAGETADAMAVEPNADAEPETEAEAVPSLTLAHVMSTFDGGAAFDGTFPAVPTSSKDKFETHVKRSTHLLLQLCSAQPALFGVVMDIAGAAARSLCPDGVYDDPPPAAPSAAVAGEGDVEVKAEGSGSTASGPEPAAVTTTAPSEVVFGPKQQLRSLLEVLRSEMSKILPAVAHSFPTDQVFCYLARCDPFAAPLLEHALGVLHSDMQQPPTLRLLETVHVFQQLNNIADDPAKKLRYTVSLLGGLPGSDVRDLLPSVLGAYHGDSELLNTAFSRIVMARPPALTKASLLVAMHRYDRTEPSISLLDPHIPFSLPLPPLILSISISKSPQDRPRSSRHGTQNGLRQHRAVSGA